MFKCHLCGDPFTRQFSLKRHMKWKHAKSNVESKEDDPKIQNFIENVIDDLMSEASNDKMNM